MLTLEFNMEAEMDAGYESLPALNRMLTSVDCIGVEKRTKPSKHHVYVLVVCWSDGVKYPIYRRYISMFDLKICLKEEFKDRPDFMEPELPALKLFERGLLFGHKDTATEKRKQYINKFCQQVLNLPEDMVRSSTVVSFYETWDSDYDNNSSQRKSTVPAASLLPLSEHHPTINGRHGSQTQLVSGGQNRDIPEHFEMRNSRLRPSSFVHKQEGILSASNAIGHSLLRVASLGINTDSLQENQYRATCDYERRRPGEVDLRAGQLVEVLEKNTTGDEDRLDDELEGDYETVCAYRAESEDEVSYTRGQHVLVTTPTLDGWWKIRLPEGKEGYTPAINLQRIEEQPEVKKVRASSTFQKRSLRGRGPPPRSRKGREAPGIGGDAASNNNNNDPKPPTPTSPDLPLHAQVRKPPKHYMTSSSPCNTAAVSVPPFSSRTERGHAGSRESPDRFGSVSPPDRTRHSGPVFLGDDRQGQLNYSKVVFSDIDEESTFAERQRQRKKYAVEYAEINPRPLPKVGSQQTKAPRGQVSPLISSSACARSEMSVSQMTTTPGQRGDGVSNTETETVHDARPAQPVPKPRGRLVKQQTHPNYENTQLPLYRPPAPDPPRLNPDPNRPALETPRVNTNTTQPTCYFSPKLSSGSPKAVSPDSSRGSSSARTGKSSTQQAFAELSRGKPPNEEVEEGYPANYENHAVVFINDFLQSSNLNQSNQLSSTQQQFPTTNIKRAKSPLTKMAAAPAAMKLGSELGQIMVQLPEAPLYPAPALPPDAAMWWTPPYSADSNMIEASVDYVCEKADIDSVLSFKKGEVGVLVKARDTNGWLGVKLGERTGWVPSQYWAAHQPKPPKPHTSKRKMNIKQVEALHENKAWFLGKISRQESEDALLEHGQQLSFLIRESTNRLGDLTLSMRYQDRVRHFPIQMTATGKYDIGKAHFADLTNVVIYYQQNALFYDELADNAPVSLGQPINRPKNS